MTQLAFHELAALYAITDVALVTSLRDGMNLVSYEYVACQSDNAGALQALQPSRTLGSKPGVLVHAAVLNTYVNFFYGLSIKLHTKLQAYDARLCIAKQVRRQAEQQGACTRAQACSS